MIRYLRDPANAITAVGLILATTGIYFAMSGRLQLGVAIVLWSLLADHLDGIVAGKTRNRIPNAGKVGKELDSFTDLVADAVFPAIALIQLNRLSVPSLLVAIVLLGAGALRLSYFNSFGPSPEGHFVGLPLSYDIPLLAGLFLLRPLFPPTAFPALVDLSLVTLALLHVLHIQVPRATGASLAGIVVFSIVSSALLAARGLA